MPQGLDHQSLENFKTNFALQDPLKQDLSAQVFANPEDFLTTLRAAIPKISPNHADVVSEANLFDYMYHGADPKLRAVAAVAYNHFKDLDNFGLVEKRDNPICTDQKISTAELTIDLEMLQENLGKAGSDYLALHTWDDWGLRSFSQPTDGPDDKLLRELVHTAQSNKTTMAGWPEVNGIPLK